MFNISSLLFLLTDKPRIKVPLPRIRTERNHYVWCSATGSPPINISLLNSSTALAHGIGMVLRKITQDGNYTCMAENEVGFESKTFLVALTGKIIEASGSTRQQKKFLYPDDCFLNSPSLMELVNYYMNVYLSLSFTCLYMKKKKVIYS